MITKNIIRFLSLSLILSLHLNAEIVDKCKDKKIISQSPYITHSIDFFDMKECIVGASIYDKQVSNSLPRTGKLFVPDKDAIKKLHPNFFFTSDWTKRSVMVDTTPLDAKGFILHGFGSMVQVENNLYTIGNVLKIHDFQTKVKEFSKRWRELAHAVDAKNKKVLLMSACSEYPYSYGKKTYLGELFGEAGFNIIQRSKKVKVFKQENELNDFIKEFKPDFIFGFVSYTKASSCSVLETDKQLPIIYLDGDLFLHPAPIVLKGLKELKSKQNEW